LAAARRWLELEREGTDPTQGWVVTALGRLAELHEAGDDFAAALPLRQEALELCRKGRGEHHWETEQARVLLDHLGRLRKLSPADLARVHEADRRWDQARALSDAGKPAGGLAL